MYRLLLKTNLVKVDNRLPELVLRLVEVSHTNLAKIAGVEFVDVRSVMMLATSHTSATRMLSMLAYTTMTG